MHVWGWLWVAAALGSGDAPPPPQPIVGGESVLECEWPSTVAFVLGGSQFCSATLVHPELVLTAAHCIHPASGWGEPSEIVFGESVDAPARTVTQTECQMHPMYDPDAETNSPEDAWDLAWCRLSAPVTDIPPTPLLLGCEVDQLDTDAEIHIVGFGADAIVPEGDSFSISGNGTKRHTVQSLEEIDSEGQLYLVSGADASACSGDSGGSVYAKLDDGSWRTLGALARTHPDAPDDPPWCVYGVVATGAFTEIEWLEQSSGIDLSPCFDADGTWAPTAQCDAFPTDPVAEASWAAGCGAQPVSDPIASCGPAFGEVDDTGGTDSTTGADSTTGDDLGDDTDDATDAGDGSSSGAPPPPPDLDGTTSGSDSTGIAEVDGGDSSGCGCRSEPAPRWTWIVFFAAGGLTRRRSSCASSRRRS